MALSKLINNQKIIIDNHNQGCRVINNWDEQSSDIHIDKMTNYKIEGRKQKVRIRIPINSERPLRIENVFIPVKQNHYSGANSTTKKH